MTYQMKSFIINKNWKKINNTAINTDTVITDIKKNFYELRDIDVKTFTVEQKEEFKADL